MDPSSPPTHSATLSQTVLDPNFNGIAKLSDQGDLDTDIIMAPSILDTLDTIQAENPNIETVFLESDDEDSTGFEIYSEPCSSIATSPLPGKSQAFATQGGIGEIGDNQDMIIPSDTNATSNSFHWDSPNCEPASYVSPERYVTEDTISNMSNIELVFLDSDDYLNEEVLSSNVVSFSDVEKQSQKKENVDTNSIQIVEAKQDLKAPPDIDSTSDNTSKCSDTPKFIAEPAPLQTKPRKCATESMQTKKMPYDDSLFLDSHDDSIEEVPIQPRNQVSHSNVGTMTGPLIVNPSEASPSNLINTKQGNIQADIKKCLGENQDVAATSNISTSKGPHLNTPKFDKKMHKVHSTGKRFITRADLDELERAHGIDTIYGTSSPPKSLQSNIVRKPYNLQANHKRFLTRADINRMHRNRKIKKTLNIEAKVSEAIPKTMVGKSEPSSTSSQRFIPQADIEKMAKINTEQSTASRTTAMSSPFETIVIESDEEVQCSSAKDTTFTYVLNQPNQHTNQSGLSSSELASKKSSDSLRFVSKPFIKSSHSTSKAIAQLSKSLLTRTSGPIRDALFSSNQSAKFIIITPMNIESKEHEFPLMAKVVSKNDLPKIKDKHVKLIEITDSKSNKVYVAMTENVELRLAESEKPISFNFTGLLSNSIDDPDSTIIDTCKVDSVLDKSITKNKEKVSNGNSPIDTVLLDSDDEEPKTNSRARESEKNVDKNNLETRSQHSDKPPALHGTYSVPVLSCAPLQNHHNFKEKTPEKNHANLSEENCLLDHIPNKVGQSHISKEEPILLYKKSTLKAAKLLTSTPNESIIESSKSVEKTVSILSKNVDPCSKSYHAFVPNDVFKATSKDNPTENQPITLPQGSTSAESLLPSVALQNTFHNSKENTPEKNLSSKPILLYKMSNPKTENDLHSTQHKLKKIQVERTVNPSVLPEGVKKRYRSILPNDSFNWGHPKEDHPITLFATPQTNLCNGVITYMGLPVDTKLVEKILADQSQANAVKNKTLSPKSTLNKSNIQVENTVKPSVLPEKVHHAIPSNDSFNSTNQNNPRQNQPSVTLPRDAGKEIVTSPKKNLCDGGVTYMGMPVDTKLVEKILADKAIATSSEHTSNEVKNKTQSANSTAQFSSSLQTPVKETSAINKGTESLSTEVSTMATSDEIINNKPFLVARHISTDDLSTVAPKGCKLVAVNKLYRSGHKKTLVLAIPDDIMTHCARTGNPLCINVPNLGPVVLPNPLIESNIPNTRTNIQLPKQNIQYDSSCSPGHSRPSILKKRKTYPLNQSNPKLSVLAQTTTSPVCAPDSGLSFRDDYKSNLNVGFSMHNQFKARRGTTTSRLPAFETVLIPDNLSCSSYPSTSASRTKQINPGTTRKSIHPDDMHTSTTLMQSVNLVPKRLNEDNDATASSKLRLDTISNRNKHHYSKFQQLAHEARSSLSPTVATGSKFYMSGIMEKKMGSGVPRIDNASGPPPLSFRMTSQYKKCNSRIPSLYLSDDSRNTQEHLGFTRGFTKADIRQVSNCSKKMIRNIAKLESSLDTLLKKIHILRLRKYYTSQLDPLEITEADVWKANRNKVNNQEYTGGWSSTLSDSGTVTASTEDLETFNDPNYDDCMGDLLITKKVVLLDQHSNSQRIKKRKTRKQLNRQYYGKKNMKIFSGEKPLPVQARQKIGKRLLRKTDTSPIPPFKKIKLQKLDASDPKTNIVYSEMIKPCYVLMNRSKEVEESLQRLKSFQIRSKQSQKMPNETTKRGRPRKVASKITKTGRKRHSPNIDYTLEPPCKKTAAECYRSQKAAIVGRRKRAVGKIQEKATRNGPKEILKSQSSIQADTFETFCNRADRIKLINKLGEFCAIINPEKPIVVINEKQWSVSNLSELSESSNIIYPVTNLKDVPNLLQIIALEYKVKFVTPDILFKYFSGER